VVQGFKKKERYVFGIEDRGTEKFIGEISLHLDMQKNIAQLSYWVGEPFWGKGFATEAVSVIIQFGFEKLELAMIFAECRVDNLGSEKVLMNNKMTRRGMNGNVVQYVMVKEELGGASE
jgi:RimJ/RimL family protein N-acetyltransferase